MKPFTDQDREPASHRPHECRVVVLGVLHPSFAQPREVSDVLPQLSSDVVTGKRKTDLIFYDPIAVWESDQPNRRRLKSIKDNQETRRKAMNAVAHELALLSMKQRNEEYRGPKE